MDRRTLLKAGVVGSVLPAFGGIALVAGRDAVRDRSTLIRAAVSAILEGALPDGGDARRATIARCTEAVGMAVSQPAPSAQQEPARRFALLASAPGRRRRAARPGAGQLVCRRRQLRRHRLRRAAVAASGVPDPIEDSLRRGWAVHDGATGPVPARLEADVAIIGSGAGGGIAAEMLTGPGLSVVIVEERPLRSSRHFDTREAHACPRLYQESGSRRTLDQAIAILQGRCGGGSTTVNGTSGFRTPESTLRHWAERFGPSDYSPAALRPWFERAERRLSIGPRPMPPNENNPLLRRGAQTLGLAVSAIRRNVKGCANLGYCGMGCPTHVKQSMRVTTTPTALDRGAFHAMAQVQFAADARTVTVGHRLTRPARTPAEARAQIDALPVVPLQTRLVSAHVTAGCGPAGDDRRGLVWPDGPHHPLDNRSVHDGSRFPTAVGTNPQLSIDGIVARLSADPIERLTGAGGAALA